MQLKRNRAIRFLLNKVHAFSKFIFRCLSERWHWDQYMAMSPHEEGPQTFPLGFIFLGLGPMFVIHLHHVPLYTPFFLAS